MLLVNVSPEATQLLPATTITQKRENCDPLQWESDRLVGYHHIYQCPEALATSSQTVGGTLCYPGGLEGGGGLLKIEGV